MKFRKFLAWIAAVAAGVCVGRYVVGKIVWR